MHIAISAILAVVCIAAAATDLASRRIPNLLTFPAMLVFLGLHAIAAGMPGLLYSLAGLGAGFALLIVPHMFGVMGAGDVKFLAAAGAALGWYGVIWAFLLASVAGGVYALILIAVRRGVAVRLFAGLREQFQMLVATGRVHVRSGTHGLPRLCYGVALAAGTLAVTAWRTAPGWIG
ncbi:MAG: prepilin peptidase [Desulfovibrionaceae bacterium]|jgi:prepilin peptidase CpaA|nr:prepilin peptidase [Desulfovibrionaceae bacterium]